MVVEPCFSGILLRLLSLPLSSSTSSLDFRSSSTHSSITLKKKSNWQSAIVERQLQKQYLDTALVRLIAFGICNPPFPPPCCVASRYCTRKIQFQFYSTFSLSLYIHTHTLTHTTHTCIHVHVRASARPRIHRYTYLIYLLFYALC